VLWGWRSRAPRCSRLPARPGAAPLPRAVTLGNGWEMRAEPAAPAKPQPPPPEESGGSDSAPTTPTPPAPAVAGPETWEPVSIPSVFDPRAIASLYAGTVRRYRLTFTGPRTPRGLGWLLEFEEVRRAAKVYLNGRVIGGNRDPYTPFQLDAKGLRAGRPNSLVVDVDNRKDPRLREGWWNWGGIVRPVRLIPAGQAYLSGLGSMSRVRCQGLARRCRASLLLDGVLERRRGRRLRPTVAVELRSPVGRLTRKTFRLPAQRAHRRRVDLSVRVPSPKLWSPEHPVLYSARVTLRDRGRVQQVVRRAVGLREVQVKRGLLYLNNRPVQMRGASIHEDMPGHGAALSDHDMAEIVAQLKELGANVTRAHYLLNDRLLSRLDRAGIMVWSQSPIWQRDSLLRYRSQRARAVLTVRRGVTAARNHPSVIAHSVANELTSEPDHAAGTRLFLKEAASTARKLDPTVPIALDINGRPGHPRQRTYRYFDTLGVNQYFGWYPWVADFNQLEPYLRLLHAQYPRHALVMTEFGAEALPRLADAPVERKGSYAFQAMHAGAHPRPRRPPAVPLGGDLLDPARIRDLPRMDGWRGSAQPGRRTEHAPPQGAHHLRRRKEARLAGGARPLRRDAAVPPLGRQALAASCRSGRELVPPLIALPR
jgi:hypothetical protein